MRLVAKWQDTRASKDVVTYRLCSDATTFIVERQEKDALGDPTWKEVQKYDRSGSHASVATLLGIGLEEVSKDAYKERGKDTQQLLDEQQDIIIKMPIPGTGIPRW